MFGFRNPLTIALAVAILYSSISIERTGVGAVKATAKNVGAPATINSLEESLERGESLRNTGKKYLISQQYKTAALCYAAALQVLEGIGGCESGELRRKCGLLLAECDIKNGNYYSAIARCSDIIDECPEVPDLTQESNSGADTDDKTVEDDEDESDDEEETEKESKRETEDIRGAVVKALYRRSVALQRLEEPRLALLDLQHALRKKPDDETVQQKIETVESILLNSDRGQGDTSDDEVQEQLQGLIEDSQLNYPRSYFTEKQINKLLTGTIGTRADARVVTASKKSPFSGGDPFSGLLSGLGGSPGAPGGLPGLGDIAGLGGMGGLGGLGGLGSLAGLGSMLGGNNTNGNPLGGIGTMLQMFAGVDSETISHLGEMWVAVKETFTRFRTAWQFIQKNKSYIFAFGTFLWVVVSSWPYIVTYAQNLKSVLK